MYLEAPFLLEMSKNGISPTIQMHHCMLFTVYKMF